MPRKFFLETRLPLISGSGWPGPPLSEGLDLPLHMYGLLFRTTVEGKVHCDPMRPKWWEFFLVSVP